MEFQSEVRRVSVRNLLLAIARKWRTLVWAAVILAILGGGLQGVRSWRRVSNPGTRAQAAEAYQAEKDAYAARQEELNTQIENLEQAIANQQAYVEGSALMNIDPYHVYEGQLYLYVSTPYKIAPGSVYQDPDWTTQTVILYKFALNGSSLIDAVARRVGMDSLYLRELVSTDIVVLNGVSTQVFCLTARGDSRALVENILSAVQSRMDSISQEITDTVGEHTVQCVVESVQETSDQKLADQQQAAYDQAEKLTLSLDETRAELAALKEPSAPSYTRRSIAMSTIKYGVLFALLGVVAVVFFVCIRFIAGDRVYSGAELEYRCGLPVLGNLSYGKGKRNALDQKLWQMEARGLEQDPQAYALLAAKLRGISRDGGELLLAGDVEPELRQTIAREIAALCPGRKISVGGSLLCDPKSLDALSRSEGVVLLAQCGTSRYSALSRQAAYVSGQKKNLLGCVAVDVRA